MFLFVERSKPAIADDVVKRVQAAPRDEARLREIIADVIVAYDNLSKGADVFPEPAIDANRRLRVRAAVQGEKRSDFAVMPPVPNPRPVNLEAKTPARDDRRKDSNYGKFEDDFRFRIERLWRNGLRPQSIDFQAEPNLLALKGSDVGAAMTTVERAARRLTESSDKPGAESTVEYGGRRVATLRVLPGQGRIGTGKGMGAPPFDAEELVDRGQLAVDAPNIIFVNLAGELLPLPDVVLMGFLAAFDRGRLGDVSGVVVYGWHGGREFLLNPAARNPLTRDEADFFARQLPDL